MKNRFRDPEYGYVDRTENTHKLDAGDAFLEILKRMNGAGPKLRVVPGGRVA
jgi:hypothetical protein